jgi:hypothetical protein
MTDYDTLIVVDALGRRTRPDALFVLGPPIGAAVPARPQLVRDLVATAAFVSERVCHSSPGCFNETVTRPTSPAASA